MMVAAAIESGCTEILSEDLNDGQDYDGVVAHNPFNREKQTPNPFAPHAVRLRFGQTVLS